MNINLPETLMVGLDAQAYQKAVAAASEPGDVDPEDYIHYKPFEDCQISDLYQHVDRLEQDFKEVFADLYSMLSMLSLLREMSSADSTANCSELCNKYAVGGSEIEALQERIKPDLEAIRRAYLALAEKITGSLQESNEQGLDEC